MSATKPRASDVARWVATLAAPEVSLYAVEMRRQDRAAKAKAKGMLASWGLDAQGNSKPEAAVMVYAPPADSACPTYDSREDR